MSTIMMTERQQRIFKLIQVLKKDQKCFKKELKELAHMLTEDDDIERETTWRWRKEYRKGRGGSRSPFFGKWAHDDEYLQRSP